MISTFLNKLAEHYRVFPKYLFYRYVIFQFILYGLIFGVFLFWLNLRGIISLDELGLFITLFASLTLLFSLMSSYYFTRPIWSMMSKISQSGSAGSEFFFEKSFSEYSDLEYVLDRIRSELKRKQDQLAREREENQVFMNSVQEALVSLNQQERLLYYNSQFSQLFLDPSQLDRKDLSLKEIFRDPDIFQVFQRALSEGLAQRLTSHKILKKDHQTRYFSISVTPLRKKDSQEIFGAVGIFYDITEIKKTEEIRHEFVGNASHELRTPLTSIKGYLEMVREDLKAGRTEQIESFLKVISDNVNRLIDLVNDLLSVNALDSSSSLKIENFSPLSLTEQVVHELMPLAVERRQKILFQSHVDQVSGDPRKIEQVIRNLVSNAIKYIGNDKQIDVVWEKGGSDQVLLRVIDNGPGIAQEHHARLFDRFYRVDKGRSRGAGGTGLGLAIVKHIIHSHGGTVDIKSSADGGCEFICQLPQMRGM